jgi:hypothetical protein
MKFRTVAWGCERAGSLADTLSASCTSHAAHAAERSGQTGDASGH